MIDPYDFASVMEGLTHAKSLVNDGVMTRDDFNTLYKHMMKVLLIDMKDGVNRNMRKDIEDDENDPSSVLSEQ